MFLPIALVVGRKYICWDEEEEKGERERDGLEVRERESLGGSRGGQWNKRKKEKNWRTKRKKEEIHKKNNRRSKELEEEEKVEEQDDIYLFFVFLFFLYFYIIFIYRNILVGCG